MSEAHVGTSFVGFPSRLRPLRRLLRELVQALERDRTDDWYAFATLTESTYRRMMLANSERVDAGNDRGIVLRITAGRCSHEWATNRLDEEVLRDGVGRLRARAESAGGNGPGYRPLTWAEERVDTLHPMMRAQLPAELGPDVPVHFGVPVEQLPDETPLSAMSDVARDARGRVQALAQARGTPLSTVIAQLGQGVVTQVFVDRHKDMSQSLVTTALRVAGVSPRGKHASAAVGAQGGLEVAVLDDPRLAHAAYMPGRLDGAERLVPGRYKLITSPEVTGVLAHEAFGHTQEGDTRVLRRSCAPALQAEGRSVGAPGATIVSNAAIFRDDAHRGTNGSMFFDDEGQLARPQVILDDGRVAGPMNDLMSSLVGDANGRAPRQCSGRRESWRRPLNARQTNTYFTPGEATLGELIDQVDHGFLAVQAAGGMEDPKGMSLTAGTAWLEEIRDGERTGRVFVGPTGGAVELSDPVPTILSGLIDKTRTWEVVPGGCQKYHKEFVNAGIGGPWILWDGITCG